MTNAVPAWWIYHGDGGTRSWRSPEAPPWRRFGPPPNRAQPATASNTRSERLRSLAAAYRADPREARLVNAAIYLRRPLLVTGLPGTGKSMLAHSIAYELGLGRVLQWSVTSRSKLADGLYKYDAVGRLQDINLRIDWRERRRAGGDVGRYLRLGPLGTALMPSVRPRVLLIDEIDKGDIDLPNDLLNVFEEGAYEIPELQRLPNPDLPVEVLTDDGAERVLISGGSVLCHEFPIVILTSNNERDFPAAFVRRCVRLELEPPDHDKLRRLIEAHFPEGSGSAARLIDRVMEIRRRRPDAVLATDQLLNAIRMEDRTDSGGDAEWHEVLDALLRPLNDGTA